MRFIALLMVLAAFIQQGLGCICPGGSCCKGRLSELRPTTFKPPNHDAFEQFKTQYNKNYGTAEEHDSRRAIFESNLELIERHNGAEEFGKKCFSFTLGLNQFADLTTEEFVKRFTGGPLKNAAKPMRKKFTSPLSKGKRQGEVPENVNWVEQGFVSPVRYQECGDCWAFASAANIESNWAIKTQTKINDKKYWVSTQQLNDCAYPGRTECAGGNTNVAFQYVHDNGGIMWEKDLPYNHGKIGSCPNDTVLSKTKAEIGVSGYHHPDSQEALQEALISSPVTVAICSDIHSIEGLHLYNEGIVAMDICDDNCSVNHAVLAVGYGKENGQAYWLIKNSWGLGWGEQGYVKLAWNEKCVKPDHFPDVFSINA